MYFSNFLLVEPNTVGSKRPLKALESKKPIAVKSPGPSMADGWWTENCKVDGICGGGDRGNKWCDIRDEKKGDDFHCSKCKYGWRAPWGVNNWCCSYEEYSKSKRDCNCPAATAGECKSTSG